MSRQKNHNKNSSPVPNALQTKPDRRSHFWFKKLLLLQAIFGTTYGGSSLINLRKKYSWLKRSSLIAYDLTITFISWNLLYSDSVDITESIRSTIKTFGLFAVLTVSWKCISIMGFIQKIFVLVYGRKLLDLVYSFEAIEKSFQTVAFIVVYISTCTLLGVFADVFLYPFPDFKSFDCVTYFVGILFLIPGNLDHQVLIALMMYSAEATSEQINKLAEEVRQTKTKLNKTIQKLLTLREKIQIMNQCLGWIILAKIFMSGIFLSGLICYVVDLLVECQKRPDQIYRLISFALYLVSQLMHVAAICFPSQKILNSIDNLSQAAEWRLTEDVSDGEQEILKVIISQKKTIGFRAADFFIVRNKTFLTFLSFVGSYTVILIQTEML